MIEPCVVCGKPPVRPWVIEPRTPTPKETAAAEALRRRIANEQLIWAGIGKLRRRLRALEHPVQRRRGDPVAWPYAGGTACSLACCEQFVCTMFHPHTLTSTAYARAKPFVERVRRIAAAVRRNHRKRS